MSTTTQIDAVYQDGVFKPLHAVGFAENQRVRLNVEAIDEQDVHEWLARVRRFQQQIISQRGHFPDSTADIAQDRRR